MLDRDRQRVPIDMETWPFMQQSEEDEIVFRINIDKVWKQVNETLEAEAKAKEKEEEEEEEEEVEEGVEAVEKKTVDVPRFVKNGDKYKCKKMNEEGVTCELIKEAYTFQECEDYASRKGGRLATTKEIE